MTAMNTLNSYEQQVIEQERHLEQNNKWFAISSDYQRQNKNDCGPYTPRS